MELRIELEADDPETMRQISDALVMEMPVKRERIKNPATMQEEREIVLVDGRVVNAKIDPIMSFDNSLW